MQENDSSLKDTTPGRDPAIGRNEPNDALTIEEAVDFYYGEKASYRSWHEIESSLKEKGATSALIERVALERETAALESAANKAKNGVYGSMAMAVGFLGYFCFCSFWEA